MLHPIAHGILNEKGYPFEMKGNTVEVLNVEER